MAAVLLFFARQSRAAEGHADYKYEVYAEDDNRTTVRTHSAFAEAKLTSWLDVQGQFVYDAISGATPTGGLPPPGSNQVPLAELDDIRRAVQFAPGLKLGPHTFRPQIAYSTESDYVSVTPSITWTLDLNKKNTTLTAGVAHSYDRLTHGIYLGPDPQDKDSTDVLLGVAQVLSRTTLLNVSLSLGSAHGYLSDPYKGFQFTEYPDRNSLFPEMRPRHRTKQIFSVTLNQAVEPADGAAELTYRFYHDSFGIFSHTVSLEWFQNIGKYLIVAPLFRYYEQTEAGFYLRSFAADPSDSQNPNNALIPQFYSADYRLSALRTLTYGVGLTVKPCKWLYFDAAYKRYAMTGLDGGTPASSYSQANVYTIGLRLFF